MFLKGTLKQICVELTISGCKSSIKVNAKSCKIYCWKIMRNETIRMKGLLKKSSWQEVDHIASMPDISLRAIQRNVTAEGAGSMLKVYSAPHESNLTQSLKRVHFKC